MAQEAADGMMARDALVSVLIPAYYSDATLGAAIDSVLQQDYRPLELIVSDDGTPGFEASEIKKCINMALPCTVLCHEQNRGTVANLNSALSAANGEWVALLAGDDRLLSRGVISAMLEKATADNRRWIVPTTLEGNRCIPSDALRGLMARGAREELYWRLCFDCFLPSSGAMFQRSLLTELGGFDVEYRLVEDWPLMLKLIRRGILPSVSEDPVLIHDRGGVSGHASGRHLLYQKDLIHVMEREILPHLPEGDDARQAKLVRRIGDKRAIYEMRSRRLSPARKMMWAVQNMDIVFRRLKEKVLEHDHELSNDPV